MPLHLSTLEEYGFRVLAEDPPRELVIGAQGAFWKLHGDLRPFDSASFHEPVPAGVARAAWNVAVIPAYSDGCILRTETRVLAGDAATRRRLLAYWLVVRLGSGVIRRLILRAIRGEADRS